MSFYNRVINHYNLNNQIKLAFAYGSAVFKQLNNNKNSITDFVFVVDDALTYHDLNTQANSKDYSYLKHFGPYYLSKIQNQYGAAVYFNTLVKFEDQLIKYGIIQRNYFLKDLYDWDYLYISGRLHKPVKILKNDNERDILDSLNVNSKNAFHTALLLLPESFSLEELFLCITNLSYHGDVRRTIGAEDKSKVLNIVKPNFDHFYELYKPLIQKENANFLHLNEVTFKMQQDKGAQSIYHNLNFLPKNLLQIMTTKSVKLRQYQDMEEIVFKLATRGDLKIIINNAINYIVRKNSLTQTIKGFFTAGIVKSINYTARKFQKMFTK
jgi:mitochondrial translocator assembly and maintenance protein 41